MLFRSRDERPDEALLALDQPQRGQVVDRDGIERATGVSLGDGLVQREELDQRVEGRGLREPGGIVFDKFHILRHLGDRSTKSGAASTDASPARTAPSSRASATPCSPTGRHSLKKLLAANRRLNTVYVLKEQFGQLWDYQREGWARAFFERWRASLKWQRLKPYENFTTMIARHWPGIAAYCKPENKVSLGVVEGLNNKIRVLQRRAYGYRDEEYLKLKIICAFLPPLPRGATRGPL